MLERLIENKYFYFLDGFSGYIQIPIDPMDKKNIHMSLRNIRLQENAFRFM